MIDDLSMAFLFLGPVLIGGAIGAILSLRPQRTQLQIRREPPILKWDSSTTVPELDAFGRKEPTL